MVKLGGPAMSLDASGTIGGILTFSKWKGRPYVRTRVVPTNPKTAAQSGVRCNMKFLAQAWAALAAPAKASWDDAADARKISAFNAYQSANMTHWRDFMPPGQTNTLLRTTAAALIASSAAEAAGRYIYAQATLGAAAGQWGVVAFVSTVTGFEPLWNNARIILPAPPSAATDLLIGPMAAGTYFIRYMSFSVDGMWNALYATEDTVTIAG